jgi:hypothetical protein
MNSKNRGRRIRCIILVNERGFWESHDHRIYFQVEKNPRRLFLDNILKALIKNNSRIKVEYLLGISSWHKRLCKKYNKELNG